MNHEEFADNHFIRTIIEDDLKNGKYQSIITRFPPEPNGYLHIGHAKSICLNFGLAHIYNGQCNLRFDDTNPEKESDEYVRSIMEDVQWLGFKWAGEPHYASDYFEQLYQYAEHLIEQGLAYVDELNADEMREYRGTLTEAGKESPYRNRTVTENLDLFRRMRAGEFEDGSKTLRLKIDMASGNLNMRDPVIYRIRRVHHHRTGDQWCIYPMYDYTHCLSDAIEHITHSICTLEFEAHRPLYDWVIEHVDSPSTPHQYEFSRLELLYSITSKRKLNQLVQQQYVSGWDDPRMPTISGMRRRGYTPAGLRLFAKRVGVSKSENVVDMDVLEGAIREDLEHTAPRMMAVLRPLKVEITNFDESKIQGKTAAYHPEKPEFGERELKLAPTIYIEADDFAIDPPKGWKRLVAGGEVRLRHSYVMKCEEVVQDSNGNITALKCSIDYDTLGKNPEDRKVKGVIHWLPENTAVKAQVRLYDRLFTEPRPDAVRGEDGEYRDFIEFLNPESQTVITAFVEPIAQTLQPESHWQFERLGYFVTDRFDHKENAIVFNHTVTLRDTWKKK
ncbi:MAG: glutamine--tRNA ligase/YqeY domain fusion protein [Neisseriaceae bacterium]|nr:glutamine--tRNA ligase/YqeY domain fusion protein [Neisseriaceae bacterium]